jgi:hypothetical protein
MSQSPLQRSTRRSLTAFAHPPSRLSKATSSTELSSISRRQSRFAATGEEEDEDPATSPTVSRTTDSRGASRPRASNSSYATPPPAKLRYDEEPAQRHTPIYYSPQATSTPPAGLSRSASIPFDMAASAKAGRTAKPAGGSRDMSAGDDASGTSTKKSRYVRKKSIFQRRASIRGKSCPRRIAHIQDHGLSPACSRHLPPHLPHVNARRASGRALRASNSVGHTSDTFPVYRVVLDV